MVFATNNEHKLREIRQILGNQIEIQSLAEIGCTEEIPEDSDTLEGNALIKARHIYSKYGCSCFADDTGLEVDALGGEPGVYSARYAGESNDSEANMRKLLQNLTGKTDRNAQFRTVIALIIDGEEKLFDGVVRGAIAEQRMGTAGFGYDPIFVPEGFAESFAQMPAEQKNSMSHRARAAAALNEYLQTL